MSNSTTLLEEYRSDPYVKIIIYAISENINNHRLSISELCSELAIGRTKLHLEIKERTNLKTSELINKVKIDLALSLIRETSLPLKDISYKCGYNSPSYFSKIFKREWDMSPLEYRRTIVIEDNSESNYVGFNKK